MARCPVCGSPNHVCGPRTTVNPVDVHAAQRKGRQMGDLREYTVMLNGVETTMQLTEAHAAQLGATPADQPAPDAPVDGKALVRPDHKAAAPPNKARRARDK